MNIKSHVVIVKCLSVLCTLVPNIKLQTINLYIYMTPEKISKVYKIFIRRAVFTLTLRDNVAIIVVGQRVHLMKTFFQ